MFLRGTKLMLQAAACMVVMAGSANAVTVNPGPTINNLDAGTTYTYTTPTPIPAGDFSNFFFFHNNITPSSDGTLDANFALGGGFTPIMAQWFSDGGSAGVADAGDVLISSLLLTSAPQSLLLALAPTANYYLKISGTGTPGGNYGYTLTTTPIPPALLLFGSALGGLGLLGRRRRSTTAAPLA